MPSSHTAVSPRAEQERLTHALRTGRPVLMFFHSSHCPLCRTLYTPVQQLIERHSWLHVAWADTDAPEWLPEVCRTPVGFRLCRRLWKTRPSLPPLLHTDDPPPRAGDLRAELRGVAAPTRRRARAGASLLISSLRAPRAVVDHSGKGAALPLPSPLIGREEATGMADGPRTEQSARHDERDAPGDTPATERSDARPHLLNGDTPHHHHHHLIIIMLR